MKRADKVAIVTGASRGLGKAIAEGLGKAGARVAVCARSETVPRSDLPGTIHETVRIIEASGGQAAAIRCDVTAESSVRIMVEKVMGLFGRIDILVNNAGVAFFYPVAETPLKRWETVLKVNLTGAFLCTREVLPHMMRQRSGSILNISSLAANERDNGLVPTGLAYAVSKAGLDRFTWGLAAEVGAYNIAVNCLKPKSVVDTEGMRLWTPEEKRKDWVGSEKMVKCALFLASQTAAGVTGTVATDEELSLWHGL